MLNAIQLCARVAAVMWVFVSSAQAHNPDTSYARIAIAPDKLDLQLTYDLFTLNRITPLDANRDGRISRAELQAGVPAITNFLHEHVLIEINEEDAESGRFTGFAWPSTAGDSIPETDFHSAAGLIHFRFTQSLKEMPEEVGITFPQTFFGALGDRHTILGVFALPGKDEDVVFNRFEPDFAFYTGREGTASKGVDSASQRRHSTDSGKSLWERSVDYLKLGVEHIFLGYDHICFLIALIVVSRFRELVWIVTSFTVAHSITLILAALQLVTLPSRLVEAGIALTIVYVALENLWIKDTRHRWLLTFCFGLIHGFGFANVLREMGLPTTGLVRCLLSFNVGVELGQLAIVLALLPLALGLGRWKHGRKVIVGLSLVLALFGGAWFLDRAFALKFMPF